MSKSETLEAYFDGIQRNMSKSETLEAYFDGMKDGIWIYAYSNKKGIFVGVGKDKITLDKAWLKVDKEKKNCEKINSERLKKRNKNG